MRNAPLHPLHCLQSLQLCQAASLPDGLAARQSHDWRFPFPPHDQLREPPGGRKQNHMLTRSSFTTADRGGKCLPPFVSAAAQHMTQPPEVRGLRTAEAMPATYSADAHTVDLVLSAGTRVKRWGYFEELLIDAKAIDLSRVSSGIVKVLNSHNAWDVGAILGTLVSARIESGQLVGTMRFADAPAALDAERMVARGDLTSVSIGYEVKLWRAAEVVTDPTTQAEITVWRGEEWTLLEVSFVSVPADPHAGVRSAVPNSGNQPANSGGANEEEEMLTRADPGTPPVTNGANVPAADRSAASPSKMSAADSLVFIKQAEIYGVEAFARDLVMQNDRGEISTDTMFRELNRAAAERQRANTGRFFGGVAHITQDADDAARSGIIEALVSRMSGNAPATDAGRQFRGMSMIDIIRYQARQRGKRGIDFTSPVDVVNRMHTTSDFPTLLTSAANRVLLAAFAAAPSALKMLARKTTIDDFRAKHSVKLGALPELPLVAEGGEVKHLSTSESYENYKLGTYAGKFALTRQALINDDLGAFADFVLRMAQAAAETEASNLHALMAANGGAGPALTDGQYLFSSPHGNVASEGSLISIPSLASARLAMRTQKSLDGKTLAPVVPKTLLVGPVKETEGEAILAGINATKLADVNPFGGKLTLAVEPRFTGNEWYVFADPVLSPVLEYAYLTGHEGPQIESKEGWDVLAEEFLVVLDFGCGVVDHRGAYRNAGAAPESEG